MEPSPIIGGLPLAADDAFRLLQDNLRRLLLRHDVRVILLVASLLLLLLLLLLQNHRHLMLLMLVHVSFFLLVAVIASGRLLEGPGFEVDRLLVGAARAAAPVVIRRGRATGHHELMMATAFLL